MKLIINFLLIIFITFNVEASNPDAGKIGDLYKKCKVVQNSAFNLKDAGDEFKMASYVACTITIHSYITKGYSVCLNLKTLKDSGLGADVNWKYTANFLGNGVMNVAQGVISFIKFAENNPNTWNSSVADYTHMFLGKDFPCLN